MIPNDKATQLYNKRNKQDQHPEINTYSLWGFGCAIAPFLVFAIPFINIFILLTPLVAIILGSMGIYKARQVRNKRTKKITDQKSLWFGITAVILGSIQILLVVVAISFFELSAITMFSYL
ncbi:MAG: hypothetical protein ACLFNM_02800 [Candidatus Woesearchaeota archaeon]